MKEVALGFKDRFEIRKTNPETGMFHSTTTIVCNISASATDQGKLVGDVGATPADVLKVGKAETKASSTITASRGNTVTLEFANLLFAPAEVFATVRKAEDIVNIIRELEQEGFRPLRAPNS